MSDIASVPGPTPGGPGAIPAEVAGPLPRTGPGAGPTGFREELSGGGAGPGPSRHSDEGGEPSDPVDPKGAGESPNPEGSKGDGPADEEESRDHRPPTIVDNRFYGGVLGYEGEEGPWVELKKVGVSFQKNVILKDISIRFEAGVTTAIVGPNGSGKSTLIKAILGQFLHDGEISVGWTSTRNTGTGYVPQHIDFDRELPMNVVDFLGMLLQKKPVFVGLRKDRKPIVRALLERVGMLEKSGTKIGRLSGGELKRVLLIQALHPEPGLVLLDEPMAALDEPGIEIFTSILRELQNMGKTIIWVEHDLMSVRKLAHRLVAVNRKIIHEGAPEDLRDGELLLKIFSHQGGFHGDGSDADPDPAAFWASRAFASEEGGDEAGEGDGASRKESPKDDSAS